MSATFKHLERRDTGGSLIGAIRLSGDSKHASTRTSIRALDKPPTDTLYQWPTSSRWWWEAGAVIVSLMSTLIIFVILQFMNGRALQHWPVPIQINSLISIFSTFARSATLLALSEGLSQLKWNHFEKRAATMDHLEIFDAASRGPWGAFIFFWKLRGSRYSIVAAGGALLTVVSLAFEPFAQQIVAFSERQAAMANETASMSIAVGLNIQGAQLDPANDPVTALVKEFTYLLPQAGSPQDVKFSCPSRECHFPSVWTLASCYECADIDLPPNDTICQYRLGFPSNETMPDFITFNNSNSFEIAVKDLANLGMDLSNSSNIIATVSCQVVTGGFGDQFNDSSLVEFRNNSTMTSNMTYEDLWVVPVKQWYASVGTIFNITNLMSRNAFFDLNDLDNFHNVVYQKRSCQISYCARHMDESVIKNGVMTGGAVGHTPLNFTELCSPNATAEDPCYLKPVYGWNGPTYSVEYDFPAKLAGSAPSIAKSILDIGDAQRSLHAVKVDVLGERAAQALSEYFLGKHNTNVTQIPGQVFGMETYVRVRWEWAILPGIVVIGSVSFLFATMRESRKKSQLFKASALVGFFYGLDGWDEATLRARKAPKNERERDDVINEKAKTMKARLARNDHGDLKFIRAD